MHQPALASRFYCHAVPSHAAKGMLQTLGNQSEHVKQTPLQAQNAPFPYAVMDKCKGQSAAFGMCRKQGRSKEKVGSSIGNKKYGRRQVDK
jgi:hypothetical protein